MKTCFLALLMFLLMEGQDCRSAEGRLVRHLLANYSKYARPTERPLQPITVSLSYYMTQLLSLEEKQQTLTSFGWLETHWMDSFLRWNPDDFAGISQLVLRPDAIWLPDFGIENSAKAIYDDMHFHSFRVAIRSSGAVQWVPGGKFVTSCQLDISYYPFDEQTCCIDMVDWAYHGQQVNLVNGSDRIGLGALSGKGSGEWQIVRTRAESMTETYESDPGVEFPRVRFTLLLRRKPMFYIINLIIPCTTMSLLALLVFYLPPDSGEKMCLGVTVLLAFSVFVNLVADNVPKTSEFVPLIGIYLMVLMSLTATSVFISVAVLNLHHRNPTSSPPRWLSNIAIRMMSPFVCHPTHRKFRKRRQTVYRLCETTSNVVFPEHAASEAPADPNPARCQSLRSLRMCELLERLREVTESYATRDRDDQLKDEWRTVARMIDRFCLLTFALIVVVATVVLLVINPRTQTSGGMPSGDKCHRLAA